MCSGLTVAILESAISQASCEQVEKSEFEPIYQIAVRAGFVEAIERWASMLEEADASRRRVLFKGVSFQILLIGLSAAKTAEDAKALQLLIKTD